MLKTDSSLLKEIAVTNALARQKEAAKAAEEAKKAEEEQHMNALKSELSNLDLDLPRFQISRSRA